MATFFETADRFAAWLEKHGGIKAELIVGYHKRGSQRPSMIWTPRKPTSIWSRINIERALVLSREGRMREAGLKAFAHRRERRLQDLIQGARMRHASALIYVKEPGREINYGTGNEVIADSIDEAKEPLQITWFADSYLDLPVHP
jgi:hypothetical protein